MTEEEKLVELRERIASWLRLPEDYTSSNLLLRGFIGGIFGGSKLSDLCEWIRDEGYSEEDVEEVFRRYGEGYPGRDEGLLRDAGGEALLKKRRRELLVRLSQSK